MRKGRGHGRQRQRVDRQNHERRAMIQEEGVRRDRSSTSVTGGW